MGKKENIPGGRQPLTWALRRNQPWVCGENERQMDGQTHLNKLTEEENGG